MRLRKPTETDLVYACLEYLALRGITAWRQNVGLAFDGRGHKVRFGFPGLSDIIGFLPDGRFLAVECKVGKRQLTPEQAAFLERVNAAGGLGLEVRDVRELVEVVEKILSGVLT